MRTIQNVMRDADMCSFCKQATTYWIVADDGGDTHHFDLPCGHSWGKEPKLTPEEIALCMLMAAS